MRAEELKEAIHSSSEKSFHHKIKKLHTNLRRRRRGSQVVIQLKGRFRVQNKGDGNQCTEHNLGIGTWEEIVCSFLVSFFQTQFPAYNELQFVL